MRPAQGRSAFSITVRLRTAMRRGDAHGALKCAPDGQWIDGPPNKDGHAPDSYGEFIGKLCAFADGAAKHCPDRLT